jgi:hypothetical protein
MQAAALSSGRVLPGDGKLVAVPEPFEVAADYVLDALQILQGSGGGVESYCIVATHQ